MKYTAINKPSTIGMTEATEFPPGTHQADVIVSIEYLRKALAIAEELEWPGKSDDIRIAVGKDGVLISSSQNAKSAILVCKVELE